MANSTQASTSASSYIDIDAVTASNFSPYDHASTLIQRTNNASDPTIDLTTPLSRALFDLQEIDSHIHTLTSRSAFDILNYTKTQNEAARKILERVEEERVRLNASYARLQKEVLGKYDKATEAKITASRSWEVLRLGRFLQRVLNIARKFETALADSGLGTVRTGKEDHRALLRASGFILTFREIMSSPDGLEIGRVTTVKTIRGRVFEDGEARVLDFARRVIREFAMSSLTGPTVANSTFKDTEDYRARFSSACHILYLLSPAPKLDGEKMKVADFEPEYLLRALQSYLQSAITSSSAAIGRALAQIPTLERTTIEVSARCQNVIALEALLRDTAAPQHPLLQPEKAEADLLNDDSDEDDDDLGVTAADKSNSLQDLLLRSLDTSALPSYFWTSLALSLSARVQEILSRGGVSARTLRTQKEIVRQEIRQCVLQGSKMPQSVLGGTGGKEEVVGNWEREAAVMVNTVIGPLGR